MSPSNIRDGIYGHKYGEDIIQMRSFYQFYAKIT